MEEKRPKLFNSNYLKVWLANFMIYFSFYFVTPLLPLYLRDVFHADKAMIGLVLSGYIVDRFSRKKVLSISYACFALFFYGYYISAIIIGFGQGSTYPAVQTKFLNMASNNQRGTANSTILTSWDLGIGIGIIIGGYVAEHLGGYNSAFMLSAIISLLSVIFFILFAKGNYLKQIQFPKS